MVKIYAVLLFVISSAPAISQVSSYLFSQQSGTYTPIIVGGGATSIGGTTDDDQVHGPLNIGFPFFYNGNCYTQFGVATNGFISLGSSAPADSYNAISIGVTNNIIAAFNNDIQLGFRTTMTTTIGSNTAIVTSAAGIVVGNNIVNNPGFPGGTSITAINGNTITASNNATLTGNGLAMNFNNGRKSYQTLGSAPNRTLVVQWERTRKLGQLHDSFSFQIRLSETSNNVEIVYGTCSNNNNPLTFEVGLRGNTSADFNNRTTTTNWLSTTAGISNTAACLVNNTLTPASGLTFQWASALTVLGSPIVCGTGTNILTALGADSYSWSTGPTTQTIAVSPTINTTYSVTGTYTAGCVSTGVISVTVAPNPTITVTGPSTLCTGQSINLSATGADTYSWSNGGNGPTVTVSPLSNIIYTATGTSTSSGCSSTAIKSVTVQPTPTLNVNGSATVCAGQPVTLSVSGADTYSWSTGSTSATITPSPLVNTIYSVTGTFSNTGCASASNFSVNVIALPVISVSGPTSVCLGQSVTINAGGGITYSWSTGSNNTGISVSPSVTSIYSVSGTSTTGCVGTAQKTITVNSLPSVTLSASQSSICVNTGTVTLTGTPAGGTYSGPYVSGNSFNPVVTGTHYPVYTYTDPANGCSNTATTFIYVFICTDEKENEMNPVQVSVFPNPNRGVFTIQTSEGEIEHCRLMNIEGKIIQEIFDAGSKTEVNISDFPRGLYFLKVSVNNFTRVFKVVIE